MRGELDARNEEVSRLRCELALLEARIGERPAVPAEDDAIILSQLTAQMGALMSQKSRLSQENDRLARENDQLRELLEFVMSRSSREEAAGQRRPHARQAPEDDFRTPS